jgi:hypothetical protein
MIGCVWLFDLDMHDAGSFELVRKHAQRALVCNRQNYSKSTFMQRSGAALSRRVNKARGLDSSRQVSSDEDVVRQMVGVRRSGEITVFA